MRGYSTGGAAEGRACRIKKVSARTAMAPNKKRMTSASDRSIALTNAWLLGDVNSREIARLELGLKYVGYEKKRDGYFIGSNVAEDRKLLKLETERNDVDIRLSSVARRVRWKQLMKQHEGKIDVELAKQFEADHFDT